MIEKLFLGLLISTGISMANYPIKNDLLSLSTTEKIAGTSLELNKSDTKKVGRRWYYSPNKFSYKKPYSQTLNFKINDYHQNKINKIKGMISSSKNSSYSNSSNNKYSTPTPKVEPKKTYHLGIGKSVYMTPSSFKQYLAENY